MPRAPKGEKRPADVIGAAVMVARIATGGIEERRHRMTGKTRRRSLMAGRVVRPGGRNDR